MQQFAEALSCRRIALLNYFGEQVTEGCGNCDICNAPPAYFDATLLAQKVCSGVARLKEREPMGMVIDVLRGAQNAQVLESSISLSKIKLIFVQSLLARIFLLHLLLEYHHSFQMPFRTLDQIEPQVPHL